MRPRYHCRAAALALLTLVACKSRGDEADTSGSGASADDTGFDPGNYDPDNPGTLIDLSPNGTCVRDVNGGAWCWYAAAEVPPRDAGEYVAPPVRDAVQVRETTCVLDLGGEFSCWGPEDYYEWVFGQYDIPEGPWSAIEYHDRVLCLLHAGTGQPTCMYDGELKTFDSPPLRLLRVGEVEVCGLTESDSGVWCDLMDSAPDGWQIEPLEGEFKDISIFRNMMCGVDFNGHLECTASSGDLDFDLDNVRSRADGPFVSVEVDYREFTALESDGDAHSTLRYNADVDYAPPHSYTGVADSEDFMCGIAGDINEVVCWGGGGENSQPGYPVSSAEGWGVIMTYPSGGGL